MKSNLSWYEKFSFNEIDIKIGLRPEKRLGDDLKFEDILENLQKFINNNLPYRSPAAIIDDVTQDNPKFKDFYKAGSVRKEVLAQHSIIAPKVPESAQPVGSFLADRAYNSRLACPRSI